MGGDGDFNILPCDTYLSGKSMKLTKWYDTWRMYMGRVKARKVNDTTNSIRVNRISLCFLLETIGVHSTILVSLPALVASNVVSDLVVASSLIINLFPSLSLKMILVLRPIIMMKDKIQLTRLLVQEYTWDDTFGAPNETQLLFINRVIKIWGTLTSKLTKITIADMIKLRLGVQCKAAFNGLQTAWYLS